MRLIGRSLEFNDGDTGTAAAAQARPDLRSFPGRGSGQCYAYDLKFGSGLAFAYGVFGIRSDKSQTVFRGHLSTPGGTFQGEMRLYLLQGAKWQPNFVGNIGHPSASTASTFGDGHGSTLKTPDNEGSGLLH